MYDMPWGEQLLAQQEVDLPLSVIFPCFPPCPDPAWYSGRIAGGVSFWSWQLTFATWTAMRLVVVFCLFHQGIRMNKNEILGTFAKCREYLDGNS